MSEMVCPLPISELRDCPCGPIATTQAICTEMPPLPCAGVGNGVVARVAVGSGVKVVVGGGVSVAGGKAFEHEPRNKEAVIERKTKIKDFISSFYLCRYRPAVCGRAWILLESRKNPKPEKCLKMSHALRAVPHVRCTLCWAVFILQTQLLICKTFLREQSETFQMITSISVVVVAKILPFAENL